MSDDAEIDLNDPAFNAASCPSCGILLREQTDALRCPGCDWNVPYPEVEKPKDIEGRSIHGG